MLPTFQINLMSLLFDWRHRKASVMNRFNKSAIIGINNINAAKSAGVIHY